MQELIDKWRKSSECSDSSVDADEIRRECASELEALVGNVYTEPPTKAQYDAHVAKHGPWMRILIADSDCCRGGWFIARLNWFDHGHRQQLWGSIPGTTWAVAYKECIGYQWSDSKGLPVEAPEVKNDKSYGARYQH